MNILKLQKLLSTYDNIINETFGGRGHGTVSIEIFSDLSYRLNLELWGACGLAMRIKGDKEFCVIRYKIMENNPEWEKDVDNVVSKLNKINFDIE